MCTASGEITVDKQIRLQVGATREEICALRLDDSPSVMSIGKRCMRLGFDFVWRGYSKSPYYILPDKRKVKMTVIGDCPYLVESPSSFAAAPAVVIAVARGAEIPAQVVAPAPCEEVLTWQCLKLS